MDAAGAASEYGVAAWIVVASPDSSASDGDGWEPATAGDRLEAGTLVRAGTAGPLTLRLAEGPVVVLGPGSVARLEGPIALASGADWPTVTIVDGAFVAAGAPDLSLGGALLRVDAAGAKAEVVGGPVAGDGGLWLLTAPLDEDGGVLHLDVAGLREAVVEPGTGFVVDAGRLWPTVDADAVGPFGQLLVALRQAFEDVELLAMGGVAAGALEALAPASGPADDADATDVGETLQAIEPGAGGVDGAAGEVGAAAAALGGLPPLFLDAFPLALDNRPASTDLDPLPFSIADLGTHEAILRPDASVLASQAAAAAASLAAPATAAGVAVPEAAEVLDADSGDGSVFEAADGPVDGGDPVVTPDEPTNTPVNTPIPEPPPTPEPLEPTPASSLSLGPSDEAGVDYVEGDPPVLLSPTIEVQDPVGDGFVGVTVVLDGIVAGDRLRVDPAAVAAAGLVLDAASDDGTVALTGTAPAADYGAVLATLTFDHQGLDPTPAPRRVVVAVDDGRAVTEAARSIDVTPVNDPPVVGAPAAASLLPGDLWSLANIVFADPDGAPGEVFTVDLQVTTGVLTVAGAVPGDVVVEVSTGDRLVLTAPATALLTALDEVVYEAPDAAVTVPLDVTVTDSGGGGGDARTGTTSTLLAVGPAGPDNTLWVGREIAESLDFTATAPRSVWGAVAVGDGATGDGRLSLSGELIVDPVAFPPGSDVVGLEVGIDAGSRGTISIEDGGRFAFAASPTSIILGTEGEAVVDVVDGALSLADAEVRLGSIVDGNVDRLSVGADGAFTATDSVFFVGHGRPADAATVTANVSFERGSDVDLSGSLIVLLRGGVLHIDGPPAFGMVNGASLFLAGGRLEIGNSPGAAGVADFAMADGTWRIELAGSQDHQIDRLSIGGSADIAGGTLDFTFADGYRLAAGERVTFLEASGGLSIDLAAVTVTVDGLDLPQRFALMSDGHDLTLGALPDVGVVATPPFDFGAGPGVVVIADATGTTTEPLAAMADADPAGAFDPSGYSLVAAVDDTAAALGAATHEA
ncbi:MAG: hypothetical protein AAFX81_12910 [Pseudomonadota bacterium]